MTWGVPGVPGACAKTASDNDSPNTHRKILRAGTSVRPENLKTDASENPRYHLPVIVGVVGVFGI